MLWLPMWLQDFSAASYSAGVQGASWEKVLLFKRFQIHIDEMENKCAGSENTHRKLQGFISSELYSSTLMFWLSVNVGTCY